MTGIGLCLPQLGEHVTTDAVVGFCREAQRLGYSSLWVQDHFLWPIEPARGYAGRPGLSVPEQYRSVWAPTELLAAAAMVTTGMRLGTSVLVQGNHWPASLAQRLATIDHLSGGRLIVGLGQGWNAEEHVASGTSITERNRRMDEFVDALKACWGPDPVAYCGEMIHVPSAVQRPKPLQRPHPPLLAGASSQDGLDRAVRAFDGWNPAGIPVEDAAKALAEMNGRRSAEQGPLSIYLRTFAQFLGPAEPEEDIVARLAAQAHDATAAGFDELIIDHNFWDGITAPDDWLSVPERFSAVLESVG